MKRHWTVKLVQAPDPNYYNMKILCNGEAIPGIEKQEASCVAACIEMALNDYEKESEGDK